MINENKRTVESEILKLRHEYNNVVDVLESMSDAFVSLDKNWCYTYMNQKAGIIFNRDPKKMVGKHIWTEFPEGIGQPFHLNYEKAMRERIAITIEEYYPPYDKWFENRIFPIETGISIFFQDITDRKKAEIALRESEDQFRTLFETMAQGVVYQDADGKIISANPSAQRILGLTLDQMLGISSVDPSWRAIHEDGTIFKGEDHPAMIALKTGKEVKNVIMGVARPDNETFCWINICATPQFKPGNTVPFQVYTTFDDITIQRLAEKEREASEKKYRLLFENMTVGFALHKMIYDQEGNPCDYRFLEVNQCFEELAGFKAADLIGHTVKEIMPNSGQNWITVYGSVAKTGSPVSYEDYVKEIGKYFDVWAFSPSPGMFATIVSDITSRKHMEEALRLSEERFKTMTESSPMAILLTSLSDQRVEYMNPTFTKLFGYTTDEIQSVSDWTSRAYPDKEYLRQVEAEWQNKAALALDTKPGPSTVEVVVTCKDGSKKNIVWGFIAINNTYLSFGQDVTEQKVALHELYETKNYLENLLNYANAPIIVWDEKYRITKFNKAFERLSGREVSEVLGQELFILFPADQREKYLEYIKQTSTGNRWEVVEIDIRHVDGSIRTLLWNSASLYSENGKNIIATIAQGQDITDRKQTMEDLQRSEARLRELNITKDKFFSIISHDLKSPFNSILGFSELLFGSIRMKNYEDVDKFAEIIHRSSKLAMDLITNLLDWTRSQTGRMEFNPEYFEIVSLINQVLDLSEGAKHQKSITINTELPHSYAVYADKEMISIIIRNLISNAIKFTNPGGTITVKVETKPGGVQISVRDNGVGMKRETIDTLFRIDKTYSTMGTFREKGTGLGLILCKEFVEKHGGRIWVESEVGKGSTFLFTIPAN